MAAGTYYVDDGGDGTQANDSTGSWATADTSINNLNTLVTSYENGDIVYFGHDHVCQATNSANLTITGPTTAPPVRFISATQGSSPVAYQQATANQIDTSEGAYDLIFDGAFALYGMQLNSGADIFLNNNASEPMWARNCIFKLAANGRLEISTTSGMANLVDCVVDLTNDGTTTRTAVPVAFVGANSAANITGLSFINAGYRTASVIGEVGSGSQNMEYNVTGCDFSGFTNATACEILNLSGNCFAKITNCKTASTWTAFTTTYPSINGQAYFVNCGNADDPTSLIYRNYYGDIISSSTIYRNSGATIEGINTSWYVTTRATYASERNPFFTPWIYGTVSSTGSKTFDLYITNDTADFNDDEVWLEVEYLGTADVAQSSLATDQRSSITATAAAQTDDTTSTWTDNDTGISPSFTYKQKLSVSATVNETGAYRARVAVGVANIATTRYFFIDPTVTVS